jgi:hypothetical protein
MEFILFVKTDEICLQLKLSLSSFFKTGVMTIEHLIKFHYTRLSDCLNILSNNSELGKLILKMSDFFAKPVELYHGGNIIFLFSFSGKSAL